MKKSSIHPKDEIWKILTKLSVKLDETIEGLKTAKALFETQWGKLMESLVDGDLVKILQEQGIKVTETYPNVKRKNETEQWEYDIIAANGTEIVVVEVKTTLKVWNVKDFLKNLEQFKKRLPKFKENKIYGAVAYLRSEEKSTIFAEKKGLFVIRATGNSASLINKKTFKPKSFS